MNESKKNLKEAKRLYEHLGNLDKDERKKLLDYMGMSKNDFYKALEREHVYLMDLYVTFNHKHDSQKAVESLLHQLKYILKYSLLDSLALLWIIHATDICTTLEDNFEQAYYLLQAAEMVLQKFSNFSRLDWSSDYSQAERDAVCATIKLTYVQYFSQLMAASEANETNVDHEVIRLSTFHIAEGKSKEHTKLPRGAKAFETIQRLAQKLLDEAKLLASEEDPFFYLTQMRFEKISRKT